MKRPLLPLAALSALLLSAGFLLGQARSGAANATPPKQQKLLLVSTIRGADAYRQFQANVQLVQAQRKAAQELAVAVEKEKDARKKKELQTRLDQAMAKLNENNEAMTKAYGFSLTRNYVLEIDTANIYLEVTDEEAARIEAAKKAQQQKQPDPKGKR